MRPQQLSETASYEAAHAPHTGSGGPVHHWILKCSALIEITKPIS